MSPKIACICNANNFFLPLVQYLRDAGYDAELIVLNNDTIGTGDPEWESFTPDYKRYTKFVNWGFYPGGYYHTSREEIEKDLAQYDFLIAQGQAPAFINKAKRIVDIFMVNGGDITVIPFQPKETSWNYKIKYWLFSRSHIQGIRNAKYIFLDKMNDHFENLFASFKTKGHRINTSCPFIYTPIFNSDTISQYISFFPYKDKLNQLKSEGYRFVLNHSRQIWSDYADKTAIKGTDLVIHGFSAFLKNRPNIKAKLIMLEYGHDTDRSKKLISELGISEHVIWLPKLKRKEIMILIHLSDIAMGQFGGGYLSSGAIYECLAMKTPIIHHREDSLYPNYESLYPLLNARTKEEISERLVNYFDNPEYYQNQAAVAYNWFLENGIRKSLNEYLKIIEAETKNKT
jgi:glycosyltransferase involved in cell wall biosynthesis